MATPSYAVSEQVQQEKIKSYKEPRHGYTVLCGVSTGVERRVVYLGPTSAGSVHDKTLADECGLTFPANALVLQDTGFQGYAMAGAETCQPRKKPRGRELPAYSLVISRGRVSVDHAHLRGQKVPHHRRHLSQSACGLCGRGDGSGLHNLRVAARA